MPALSYFKISFLTTSRMLGFSLLWCSIEGLWSSSIKIRCMYKEGWIPFKLSRVYPMVLWCFLSTLTKESIWVASKLAFTITWYVDFGPRNSYLKDEGMSFNSSLGTFASSNRGLLSSCNVPSLARESGISGEASRSWAYSATLGFSSLVVQLFYIKCSSGSLELRLDTVSHIKVSTTWILLHSSEMNGNLSALAN